MLEIQQQRRKKLADKETKHKEEIFLLKTIISKAAA